jgi:uncharacterized protein (TIGR02246 family)
MKSFSVAALAIAGMAALPLAASADSAEDEVTAAYQAWDAALNSGDAKAVAAFYTDDAIFLPASHDVIEGPAGVEKFFAPMLAGGFTGHKLELIEVMGDDDDEVIVAAAKWSGQGKDAAGAAATWSGVATHVFEKQDDGSLKLKLHTFN